MGEKRQIPIEEQKQIQLDILKKIDNFCNSNGIKYFLTAGSLIGALRHKGFIPWDDDIDLVMLRPDYERFIHNFCSEECKPYAVMYREKDRDFSFSYAKIYDSKTIYYEGETNVAGIGVNVDLFPLDFATDDYERAKELLGQCEHYTKLVGIKTIVKEKKRVWYKSMIIKLAQMILKPISYHYLFDRIDAIARKYEQQTDSKYVINAVIHAKGEREILERAWFDSTVDVEFEGELFKAPIGYDAYMKRLFGDYMTPPPKEQRVTHHYNRAYYK